MFLQEEQFLGLLHDEGNVQSTMYYVLSREGDIKKNEPVWSKSLDPNVKKTTNKTLGLQDSRSKFGHRGTDTEYVFYGRVSFLNSVAFDNNNKLGAESKTALSSYLKKSERSAFFGNNDTDKKFQKWTMNEALETFLNIESSDSKTEKINYENIKP